MFLHTAAPCRCEDERLLPSGQRDGARRLRRLGQSLFPHEQWAGVQQLLRLGRRRIHQPVRNFTSCLNVLFPAALAFGSCVEAGFNLCRKWCWICLSFSSATEQSSSSRMMRRHRRRRRKPKAHHMERVRPRRKLFVCVCEYISITKKKKTQNCVPPRFSPSLFSRRPSAASPTPPCLWISSQSL